MNSYVRNKKTGVDYNTVYRRMQYYLTNNYKDEGISDEDSITLPLCGNWRFVTLITNVRRVSLPSDG